MLVGYCFCPVVKKFFFFHSSCLYFYLMTFCCVKMLCKYIYIYIYNFKMILLFIVVRRWFFVFWWLNLLIDLFLFVLCNRLKVYCCFMFLFIALVLRWLFDWIHSLLLSFWISRIKWIAYWSYLFHINTQFECLEYATYSII